MEDESRVTSTDSEVCEHSLAFSSLPATGARDITLAFVHFNNRLNMSNLAGKRPDGAVHVTITITVSGMPRHHHLLSRNIPQCRHRHLRLLTRSTPCRHRLVIMHGPTYREIIDLLDTAHKTTSVDKTVTETLAELFTSKYPHVQIHRPTHFTTVEIIVFLQNHRQSEVQNCLDRL